MITWLTTNAGLAGGVGAVAVVAVVAGIAMSRPEAPQKAPISAVQVGAPAADLTAGQRHVSAPVTEPTQILTDDLTAETVQIAAQPLVTAPPDDAVIDNPEPDESLKGEDVVVAVATLEPVLAANGGEGIGPARLAEPDSLPANDVAPIMKPVMEPQTPPEKVALLVPKPPSPQDVAPPDIGEKPQNPAVAKAPSVITDLATPGFDLVRVDADGSAVIAGSAEPGQVVRIRIGKTTLQTVTADSAGTFVALMDLPASSTAQPLVLEAYSPSGQVIPSADNVLVLPFTPERNAPPKIILASAGGVSVLQGDAVQTDVVATGMVITQALQASAKPDLGAPESFDLSLDIISYDQTGDVVLAGRGASDNFVRVYVDNRPIETETVLGDGQWRVTLPEVKEGVYTLRVDQIDAAGVVTSRVESPFKREGQKRVASVPIGGSITVQPGHTLWELAREQYGDGVNYVQIFNANRDRIRNPNLIYPGQVFALP